MPGLRRAILPLALFVAIAVAVPHAWRYVSTIPERDPDAPPPSALNRGALPSLPFELNDTTTQVRVLRWGDARGLRHGPIVIVDANGTVRLRGAYERGERVGTWEAFDPEAVLVLQGVYRDDLRDGAWIETLGRHVVDVEYAEGAIERWRARIEGIAAFPDGVTPWVDAPADFTGQLAIHGVRAHGRLPGSFAAIGLGTFRGPGRARDALDPTFLEVGTWICFDVRGTLEACGPVDHGAPVGGWTFFDDRGEIERQAWFGREEQQRERAPWVAITESLRTPTTEVGEDRLGEGEVEADTSALPTPVESSEEAPSDPRPRPRLPDASAPAGQG